MDDSKETMSFRPNRTDTWMNSQNLWQQAQGLYRLKPHRIPALWGGNGHGLPPIPEELSVIDTSWQRKNISFRQWCLTGCINHASGQGPCPGVVGRHKRNSMVFLYEYCFIWLFFLSVFCLFILMSALVGGVSSFVCLVCFGLFGLFIFF